MRNQITLKVDFLSIWDGFEAKKGPKLIKSTTIVLSLIRRSPKAKNRYYGTRRGFMNNSFSLCEHISIPGGGKIDCCRLVDIIDLGVFFASKPS